MAREERDLYPVTGGEEGDPKEQDGRADNDDEPRWPSWLHNFFGY